MLNLVVKHSSQSWRYILRTIHRDTMYETLFSQFIHGFRGSRFPRARESRVLPPNLTTNPLHRISEAVPSIPYLSGGAIDRGEQRQNATQEPSNQHRCTNVCATVPPSTSEYNTAVTRENSTRSDHVTEFLAIGDATC